MNATDGEDLLGYLQRSAREGTLLASCGQDVVEFMHQLDVLITAKQTQWERKEVALRDLLQTRERDLSGLRLALQEREKEVSSLKESVSVSQRQNMDGQSVYAKQVDRLKSELQRLSHNYEKLRSKKRQTGGGRAPSSSGGPPLEGYTKLSEATRLRDQRDLLELRLREMEGEKGRLDGHLLASRNEIAALQGRCLSLQEKLDSSQHEGEQLRREKQMAVEEYAQTTRELEEKLDQTLHLLDGRESLVRSLREEQEEASRQLEAGGVEVRQLNEQVCSLQESLRRTERQRCELRQQLKLKEESLQALTAESQKLSSALRALNSPHSSEQCSRSLRGEEEEEGGRKATTEIRKECDRLRRKAMAYKHECASLRAQLAAALVQGEVVKERTETAPHLEQTVAELMGKLRSLEESWKEERERLLEENKRLEAVGQQRSQDWQMALEQVRQLERELDSVKQELVGSQKQLQAALKYGERDVSPQVSGSHAALSERVDTSSTKRRQKRGAVLSTGGSSPQLRDGRQCGRERKVPQDDSALLKTLDDILSKHFSEVNAKLSSTNATS